MDFDEYQNIYTNEGTDCFECANNKRHTHRKGVHLGVYTWCQFCKLKYHGLGRCEKDHMRKRHGKVWKKVIKAVYEWSDK